MSSIEEITGELPALTAGLDRARSLTAAADHQAEQIAGRAVGAGFAAVAAGMARVRAGISAIQAGLSGAGGTVGEASTAATSVSWEAATPQETIAALTQVQRGIRGVRQATTATIGHVDQTRQLVGAVLQGGQPGPLLQSLDSVKQVLVLVVQRCGTAHQAAEAAVGQARGVGSLGN
ncbi:DUF6244 family protein [Micromonospora echinofusca]|uniref:Excreted virulence factor EspC, type VII ESX diderm n=1 Tax=Micromonospora echinofusca TaxID=47858 RepID=A0ABS3VX50_MICEH|nr:DUF6244 family protein [Micromonospora echinofusca]MBO4209124.1 hypothetical protein [Micromonospora echinofusca]